MAGYQVRGDWWAWTPIVGVIVIGSFWAQSIQPVQALFKSIWKDWTLLSFTLYGALPLLFLFAYDEVRNKEPAFTAIMLILAGGAVFYLRAENIRDRFIRLGASFTLGWLILMVHQAIYWNGRQEFGMREPGSWVSTLSWTSRFGAFLILILSAPALIGLLRWIIQKRRSLETEI